jgi:hypothetical protein
MTMDGAVIPAKAVVFATCAMVSVLTAAAAQAAAPAYKAPRNGFGQPDLGGTWTNTTMTPMERPAAFGTRSAMTPQEVASVEAARAKLLANGAQPTAPGATVQDVNKTCDLPGVPATTDCAYNVSWFDSGERVMRVNGEPRASLITFPADGRIPYKAGRARPRVDRSLADNPEDRNLSERCLVSRNVTFGALLSPALYNNTYLIQQSGDTVAVVFEMSHDLRYIRLNAQHGTAPRWFGDSVGRWDGDTLVVDTINFHPEQLAGNSPELHVVERFTRVGKDRLLYQFRIEDPVAYAAPWGGEYEFYPSGPLYEFACHEGNHGLSGILAGARSDEKVGKGPSLAAAGPPGSEDAE